MKKWIKYLISVVVFLVVYALIEYLLTKSVNWKMIIVTTIIYGVLYTTIDLICDKYIKKVK